MNFLDRVGFGVGSAVGNFARGRAMAAAGMKAAGGATLRAADLEDFQMPDLGFAYNQEDLYQRLTWVAIAISIVAEQAAGKTIEVKRILGDREEDIPNHEYEQLHEQPNELWTGVEFWRAMISYRKLTGNGYAWLNRSGPMEKPAEMWVIPSHHMQPIPDGKLGIRGYWYYPNGFADDSNRQPLQPWEVLHLKGFHPLNKYVGLSDISQLALVAEGDLAMQKYNKDYFKRDGGRIPGVLAFADPIADPEWLKLQSDFKAADKEQRMVMLRNAGKGGIEWVATAMSRKDMEFLAGRKANKEEIYEWIAPGLVSWLSMSSTEANSRSGRDAFYELAVWPRLQELAAKITKDPLPAYGEGLKAEYEGVRPRDTQRILQEQLAFERTHTVDETRAEYYKDNPLGDERGELIARVASAGSGGIEGLEEPINVAVSPPSAPMDATKTKDNFKFQVSNFKLDKAMPAAKAKEMEKFKKFVKRRTAEEKVEKIEDFQFVELDEAEQTALKAKVLGGDWALKEKLQALIGEVQANA